MSTGELDRKYQFARKLNFLPWGLKTVDGGGTLLGKEHQRPQTYGI